MGEATESKSESAQGQIMGPEIPIGNSLYGVPHRGLFHPEMPRSFIFASCSPHTDLIAVLSTLMCPRWVCLSRSHVSGELVLLSVCVLWVENNCSGFPNGEKPNRKIPGFPVPELRFSRLGNPQFPPVSEENRHHCCRNLAPRQIHQWWTRPRWLDCQQVCVKRARHENERFWHFRAEKAPVGSR